MIFPLQIVEAASPVSESTYGYNSEPILVAEEIPPSPMMIGPWEILLIIAVIALGVILIYFIRKKRKVNVATKEPHYIESTSRDFSKEFVRVEESRGVLPRGFQLHRGTYNIVRFIKRGGFGCTYEAEHVLLRKRVAIKEFFVKDFCNRDEQSSKVTVGTESKRALVEKLKRKFIDEARALSDLDYSGIVKVSDIFEENGTAYFIMDYIDGRSLSDIIKDDGPLYEGMALYYISQVAKALAYVHAHNRLHLDIKPGNIMVDKSGNAILIDFGASKQYDECDGENTSTLLGKTPGYAPPEQMGNDVVKFLPSTDIYALGATLYKLLCGNTPISATLRISGEDVAPLPGYITNKTRVAIDRAMQLNKNARPQSIREFLQLMGISLDSSNLDVLLGQLKRATADLSKEIATKKSREEKRGKANVTDASDATIVDGEWDRKASSKTGRRSVTVDPEVKIGIARIITQLQSPLNRLTR